MPDTLSPAIQDYLRVIYNLTAVQPRATTNAIAAALAVKPASVTAMLQKMARATPPLVDYQKRGGAGLTAAGQEAALRVIRRHRLLETFLHDTLGYSWDEVHEEADRLEHVISGDLANRIARQLGHPRHDPHGDPIPTRDLALPAPTTVPLQALPPGQTAVVRRIRADDGDLLRHLAALGVMPGARIERGCHRPADATFELWLAGHETPVVLGERAVRQIEIETDPAPKPDRSDHDA